MVRVLRKGFTLVELLTVIVISAILLGIGYYSYHKWKVKLEIETEIKEVYSLLETYRMVAFTHKENYSVIVNNGTQLQIEKEGSSTPSVSFKFKYPLIFNGNSNLSITKGGIFHPRLSMYVKTKKASEAQYNCIAVTEVNLKLGKWNESKKECE